MLKVGWMGWVRPSGKSTFGADNKEQSLNFGGKWKVAHELKFASISTVREALPSLQGLTSPPDPGPWSEASTNHGQSYKTDNISF